MQSPNHSQSTANQLLSKGPGYKSIYDSGGRRVEISQKSLRILWKDKKGELHENLYIKELDPERKRKMGYKSENWHLYPDKKNCNYWILQQRNAQNKPTGIIRMIEKGKADRKGLFIDRNEIIAHSESDWIYYAKRGGDI